METSQVKQGPDAWGPHGWKFLHYVSLGYPTNPTQEHKEKYKAFFELLKYTLPCQLCRGHYEENYNKSPLTNEILSDREKFIKWVIDLHNIVNEMKNKPIVKYEDARKMIETDVKCYSPYTVGNNNSNNNSLSFMGILIVLLIIILLGYSIYKHKKNLFNLKKNF